MSAQPTGIQLNAKLSIWFILTMIFPLVVTVDGVASKGTWGDQSLPVAPGSHTLAINWKLYWLLPANSSSLSVQVNPGEAVPVRYKVRLFWFLPGKLYIDTAPAAA